MDVEAGGNNGKRKSEIGNMHHVYGSKTGGVFPWSCVIGPSVPFFVLLLTVLVTGSSYHFLFVALRTQDFALIAADLVIFPLVTYYFLFTATSDPGIVISTAPPPDVGASRDYNYCPKCNVLRTREMRSSHCDECDVCIEGLDHHCIWMGKCVGKNTLGSFYRFIFLFFAAVVYAIPTGIIWTIQLQKADRIALSHTHH